MKRFFLLCAVVLALCIGIFASTATTPTHASASAQPAISTATGANPSSCCGGDPGGGGTIPFAPASRAPEVALAGAAHAASCCGGDPGGGPWPFAPSPIPIERLQP